MLASGARGGLLLVAMAAWLAGCSGPGLPDEPFAGPEATVQTLRFPEPELPAGVEPVAFDVTIVGAQRADGRTVSLRLLVADTIERRTRGLMYRTELPPDGGMLFAFPLETHGPFWNKDTPLNLDIAFLDGEGRVLEIVRLEALSTELVTPLQPYWSAVEMLAGWFAANGFRVGDRFHIPTGIEGQSE